MSKYAMGTVSVELGSAIVTGSNTNWDTEVSAGDWFYIANDGFTYVVATVDSATQVTLTGEYLEADKSGQNYEIGRDFTSTFGFRLPNPGDRSWMKSLQQNFLDLDSQLAVFSGPVSTFALLNYKQMTDVVVTNTVTETSIVDNTGAIGSVVIDGGDASAGDIINVKILGNIDTGSSPVGTSYLKIYLNSTLVDTLEFNVETNLTEQLFQFDFPITYRSIGTTGTVIMSGTTATVNTTIDQTLDVTWTWGSASTDNTLSITQFIVKAL